MIHQADHGTEDLTTFGTDGNPSRMSFELKPRMLHRCIVWLVAAALRWEDALLEDQAWRLSVCVWCRAGEQSGWRGRLVRHEDSRSAPQGAGSRGPSKSRLALQAHRARAEEVQPSQGSKISTGTQVPLCEGGQYSNLHLRWTTQVVQ